MVGRSEANRMALDQLGPAERADGIGLELGEQPGPTIGGRGGVPGDSKALGEVVVAVDTLVREVGGEIDLRLEQPFVAGDQRHEVAVETAWLASMLVPHGPDEPAASEKFR